jgi:hypothetical protein
MLSLPDNKDRSLLSFMNQADEAFHRLMHDNDDLPTTNNTTMMIPSSRTFEYDYDEDYSDPYAMEESVPAVPAVQQDRTVPFTLTTAIADGVSFLDMSVWSVDPYGTSVLGKENADDRGQPQQSNKDEQCQSTPNVPETASPDEEDNDAEDEYDNDEYEDNDDCSVTTAIPRALRVRPTVTYDVSVLTMDPALYSHSPYVEC